MIQASCDSCRCFILATSLDVDHETRFCIKISNKNECMLSKTRSKHIIEFCMCMDVHRVTDFEKFPVRISKIKLIFVVVDAIASSWAFVYFPFVSSSFSSHVRCVAFRSFSLCLL